MSNWALEGYPDMKIQLWASYGSHLLTISNNFIKISWFFTYSHFFARLKGEQAAILEQLGKALHCDDSLSQIAVCSYKVNGAIYKEEEIVFQNKKGTVNDK